MTGTTTRHSGAGLHIVTSLTKKGEDAVVGEMTGFANKWKLRHHDMFRTDRYKTEVMCRVAISFLAAHILSIASLPSVVPPSFKSLIIVLVQCFYTLPKVLFISLGVFPSVFIGLLIILAFATMLLAAATVSDGALVAVFSLYCYWTVSVYFGERYNKDWKMGQILLCITALFALGFRPLLEQVPETDQLELVNQLWKQRGVDNDLAVMRNVMIIVCWAVAVVLASSLLPVYHTARSTIATELLPALLKQTVAVISGKLDATSLTTSSDVLKQGQIADMALFEPPPLGSKHGFLLEELQGIVADTDKVILATIAIQTGIQQKYIPVDDLPLNDGSVEKGTSALLGAIAAALMASNNSSPNDDVAALEQFAVMEDTAGSPYHVVYERAKTLRRTALTWLHALHSSPSSSVQRPPFKARASNFSRNQLKIWIAAPFVGWPLTLLKALAEPFQPDKWVLRPFLWKLKRTAGAVALFCMSVYWDAYANFAINREDWRLGAVFYGWDLTAYSNSWRPTMEGTFLKGLQRLLGTCLGGFYAWLGVIICRGSYDDNASINPYGLTAYLTVVSTALAYLSLRPGLGARFGVTFDSFYIYMYALVNASLLALDVYLGSAKIGGLVVNRIVATATGVGVACLVAIVPPFVKGGSPKHAYDCLLTLEKSFQDLLGTYADRERWAAFDPKKANAMFVHPIEAKREYADFVLTDALLYDSVIAMYAPRFATSAGLKPLLADIQVTVTFLSHLVTYLEAIKGEQEEALRAHVAEVLEVGLDRAFDDEEMATALKDLTGLTELQDQASLLIRIVHSRKCKHRREWEVIGDYMDSIRMVDRLDALERENAILAEEIAKLKDQLDHDQQDVRKMLEPDETVDRSEYET